LQLEAARIVTGLTLFASSILIYKELGWESFEGINESYVFDSLQNGIIISLPLRNE
jgi:hypothetical protein